MALIEWRKIDTRITNHIRIRYKDEVTARGGIVNYMSRLIYQLGVPSRGR